MEIDAIFDKIYGSAQFRCELGFISIIGIFEKSIQDVVFEARDEILISFCQCITVGLDRKFTS
jgi:hypothetical protein